MRLRKTPILGAVVVAVFALPFAGASADHSCNGTVTPVATPAGTFYMDDRGVDTNGVWIYQESNGVEGLQSGGANDLYDDPCAHENPDTLIF